MQSKAAQSQGAGTWLWVEDHGALTHTPFTRLPLAHKVRELADLFRSVFDEYPHVAGIVYSNASRRRLPLPAPQTEDMTEGIGLVRGVPLDRVRETIILHPMLVRADQTSLMARLCAEEPSWFGWALQQEQVPMGLNSLIIQPQQRLWTP
ncbi:hypothetical protein [Streptomyces rugosispiralis]|uniref:Uncharacterized protein n=1 Tax=Streptomyces rugosispiralis TaxID=2967341 RepID=A0ABT1UYC9_9ACTN|nr:hypothetical protein [Streptomyces rugosispiralis]MCQ8190129.1 hypothetical protein [Streptomyces rugosispiralis]